MKNKLNKFEVIYKSNLLILNIFFIFLLFFFNYTFFFSIFFFSYFSSNFSGTKHNFKIQNNQPNFT